MRGRDEKGRFLKGNGGGPGRPTRRTEEEYLVALTDAVPIADWKKIVAKTVELAKDGDSAARQWLGRYLIGDPQLDPQLEPPELDDAAEPLARRLALVESYLRPLGLIDASYPIEEVSRVAAALLMQVDGERIVRELKAASNRTEDDAR